MLYIMNLRGNEGELRGIFVEGNLRRGIFGGESSDGNVRRGIFGERVYLVRVNHCTDGTFLPTKIPL
jgi:hypothetical protein